MLLCWRRGNGWVRVGSVQILERKQDWKSLTNAVTPEGNLTHVQQIGEKPENVKPEHNQEFGSGAFLISGTEIMKLKT